MSAKDKSLEFFSRMSKLLYFIGSPDISIEPDEVAVGNNKMYSIYSFVWEFLLVFLCIIEIGAVFTQTHLTEEQRKCTITFACVHPFFLIYIFNAKHFRADIKELVRNLIVGLKEFFYDDYIEKMMLRRVKLWCYGLILMVAPMPFIFGAKSVIQVVSKGETFAPIITVWPDILDDSLVAIFFRIFSYLLIYVLTIKTACAYIIAICSTICLSYQYKTVQSYFMTLPRIFEEYSTQEEKEKKFECAFIAGISLHYQTMQCTKKCQKVFNIVFTSQVFLNMIMFLLLMSETVNSEHNVAGIFNILQTMVIGLFYAATIMLNAGNVTVEAANVPTAMYMSGWENCTNSTTRIRTLVLRAMNQAQKPDFLRIFGFIPLTYESFLTIANWSYSIFSVLY